MQLNFTAAVSAITFRPVVINRGRKFRGEAYDIGYQGVITSANWAYTAMSIKLWDPVAKRFVYANPEFLERRDVDPEVVKQDALAYLEAEINGTIKWCASVRPDMAEGEVLSFARNVLRKRNSLLVEAFDIATAVAKSESVDIVGEIEKSLAFFLSLRTRPGYVYKKWCAGGKAYPAPVTVRRAYASLKKRGITNVPGFAEAWELQLVLHALPTNAVKDL